MKKSSVDLVVTSPPYSDMKKYASGFAGVHPDKYVDWFMPFVSEIDRILKKTGSFILNINDKVVDGFRHTFVFDLVGTIVHRTELKLYERLFWNKGKFIPYRYRFGDKVEYLFWFAKDKSKTFNLDDMRVPYDPKSIVRMKSPVKARFQRKPDEKVGKKEWKPNEKGALPSTLVTIGSETKKILNSHCAVYPEKLV